MKNSSVFDGFPHEFSIFEIPFFPFLLSFQHYRLYFKINTTNLKLDAQSFMNYIDSTL